VAVPGGEKQLDGAIRRPLLNSELERGETIDRLKPGAELPGQVCQLVPGVGMAAMDPSHYLPGPIGRSSEIPELRLERI
jgi:hypothetical protein